MLPRPHAHSASLLLSSPPLHCQQRGRRRPRPLRLVLQVLEHVRRQVLVEPDGRHLVGHEEELLVSETDPPLGVFEGRRADDARQLHR